MSANDYWSQFEEVKDGASKDDYWSQFEVEDKSPRGSEELKIKAEEPKSFGDRLYSSITQSPEVLLKALSEMGQAGLAGGKEGAAHLALSPINLGLEAAGQETIPYPEYLKDAPQDLVSQGLGQAAKFGTELGGATKLFRMLQGLGKSPSVIKDIASGAGTGLLMGGAIVTGKHSK